METILMKKGGYNDGCNGFGDVDDRIRNNQEKFKVTK